MRHNITIKDLYFSWLYDMVCDSEDHSKYRRLLSRLHSREFVWMIPNDDNRVADGIDLRSNFADSYGYDISDCLESLDGPCSVLEMMVALSIRCVNDICDEESNLSIFWEMLSNLELLEKRFQDGYFGPQEMVDVDKKVDILVKRLYKRDGSKGGIFPVFGVKKDQRKTELWYQLQNYILEKKT